MNRHVKSIILINWQGFIYKTIYFDTGLNIFYGETGRGKSSTRLALSFLFFNECCSENDYRREGTKETSVEAEFSDNIKIKRIKSNTINRYILTIQEIETVFDSIGKTIPKEIQEIIGASVINIDKEKINLNIAIQHTLPFLADKSATFRMKLLNMITGNDVVDKLAGITNKSLLELSRKNKNIIEQKESIEENIKNTKSNLNTLKLKYNKLNDLQNKIINKNEELETLQTIQKKYQDLLEKIELIEQNLFHIEIDKIDIKQLKIKHTQLEQLNQIKKQVVRLKSLQEENKVLSKIKAFNPEAALAFYNNEKSILNSRLDLLQKEALVKGRTEQSTQKNLAKQGQIRKSLILLGNADLSTSKAILGQEKLTLDIFKKEVAAIKNMTKVKQSLLEEQIKASNLAASPNAESKLTIEQKIAVSDSSYIARLDAVEHEVAIKAASIALEYDLLDAKFQLLKQQSIVDGKQTLDSTFIAQYEASLKAAKKLSLGTLEFEKERRELIIKNRKTEQDRIKIRKDELDAVLIPQSNLQKAVSIELDKQETILNGIAAKSSIVASEYEGQVELNTLITDQKLLQLKIMEKQVKLSQLGSGDISGKNALSNEIEILTAQGISLSQRIKQKERNISDMGELSNTLTENFGNGMTTAFDNIITGTESIKDAFGNMAISVLKSLSRMVSEMMAVYIMQQMLDFAKPIFSTTPISSGAMTGSTVMDIGKAHARYGGILEQPKQFATGGIASGSSAGYPVTLHGKEAVVPLPQGNSIPVDLKGQGGTQNVTVNVNISDSNEATSETNSDDSSMNKLGGLISMAVQNELQRQKRPGGILSPYGAA